MQDSHFRIWTIFLSLVLAIALAMNGFGRLDPITQLDTKSYRDFPLDNLVGSLNDQRTFAYPVVLKSFEVINGSYALIPMFQYAISALAAAIFMAVLLRCKWQPALALAATLPLLTSNMLLGYSSLLSPDLLAQSLGIMAISIWLYIIHTGRGLTKHVLLATLMFLAYQLKPSYLFLVAFVPIGGAFARWWLIPQSRDSVLLGIKLLATSLGPFLGWCSLRWALVGHFGLVSFGGYNIIGITGQLLNRESVSQLKQDVQPLALEILEQREERSDWETQLRFSKFESQYNPMVWEIAVPLAKKRYDNDSRRMNYELSSLSQEIIKVSLFRYLYWLALGANHAAMECIDLTFSNPMSVIAIVIMLVCHALRWHHADRRQPIRKVWACDREYQTIVWLGIGYAVCSLSLVILVEIPISRYCAPASVFFPSLLMMFALSMLTEKTLTSETSPHV